MLSNTHEGRSLKLRRRRTAVPRCRGAAALLHSRSWPTIGQTLNGFRFEQVDDTGCFRNFGRVLYFLAVFFLAGFLAAVFFLAAGFLATVFFTAVFFLGAAFFAVVFLAAGFFFAVAFLAGAFFAAGFFAGAAFFFGDFLATVFFTGAFLGADFFATAFAMFCKLVWSDALW